MSPEQSSVQLKLRGRAFRTYSADSELLVSRQGELPPTRVPAWQVSEGDYVGVKYGWDWQSAPVAMPCLTDRPSHGSEKQILVPKFLTAELAFLLGAYLSEGHTTRSNWSVILTNSVLPVLERAQRAWAGVFGLSARITRQPGKCPGLVVSSKRLVEYMDVLGCGARAAGKRVPAVMMAAGRDELISFMQGVALDAYTTHSCAGKWAICLESRTAIDQLQDLLTRLGVVNAQIPKFNKTVGKTYYELYAPGSWGQKMCRIAPFLEPGKADRAMRYQSRLYRTASTDLIPGIRGPELYALVPKGWSGRAGRGTGRQSLTHLCDPRTRLVTRASVERARAAGALLPAWLTDVLTSETRFVPVIRSRTSQ